MKRFIITKGLLTEMVKKMSEESVKRAYMFDWDDNILFMPTKIKMDKKDGESWIPVDVSTEDFRELRKSPDYRLRNGDAVEAFYNFRDDDKYIEDVTMSLKSHSFGPSYEKFIEAIKYVNPFSIITARGHSPQALRQGTEMVLRYSLSGSEFQELANDIRKKHSDLDIDGYDDSDVIDAYLDKQVYNPVSSDEFIESMSDKLGADAVDANNPEIGKKIAIKDFVSKVVDNINKEMMDKDKEFDSISFGFSDDDLGNVEIAEELIEKELKQKYPNVKFVVYYTGDRNKVLKIKKHSKNN